MRTTMKQMVREVKQMLKMPVRLHRIPLRRLGTPEDCARVVEFLATDLSDYVTGQCIAICGGMVLSPC